jgi:RimJ/RimL family protein N-acetyltransferase
MPATPPDARPIRLETERFLLRTLYAKDATQVHLDWLADPEVMAPLNRRPSRLTQERLARTIVACDGISGFQIGIFDRISGTHIGNYMVQVDHRNHKATFSVMIGDRDYWGKKVVPETRPALLDYFFDELGIEKAIGLPPARNFPSVFNYKLEGWRLEGVMKGELKSELEEGRVDQLRFALLKDEWHAIRNGTTS